MEPGKNVGTKRPLTQKQIWAIRFHLDREGSLRDKALFDHAIDSKLRGCDLVKIKIGDVVAGPNIRNRAIVIHQKTNRPVQFELTADVRGTLVAWLERRGGSATEYLFPSRVDHHGDMSTRQYDRLVDEWVTAIAILVTISAFQAGTRTFAHCGSSFSPGSITIGNGEVGAEGA